MIVPSRTIPRNSCRLGLLFLLSVPGLLLGSSPRAGLRSVDQRLTRLLQGSNAHPALDYAMEGVALGTPVMEFGWAWYRWRYEQQVRDMSTVCLASEAWAVNGVITLLLKYTILRERPARAYKPRLWNTRITPSFPSGHVASSAIFATVLADDRPRLAVPMVLYTLASAYSQIYVGNHYVSDVLAGAILGLLVGKFVTNRQEHISIRSEKSRVPATFSLTFSFSLLSNRVR